MKTVAISDRQAQQARLLTPTVVTALRHTNHDAHLTNRDYCSYNPLAECDAFKPTPS